MKTKIKLLEITYLTILALLFLCVIYTPHLIKHSLIINGNLIIEEEFTESILIIILIMAGYLTVRLYKREIDKKERELDLLKADKDGVENRLLDAFKYIGAINVQIQEIKAVFSSEKKYPENKKDFKNILTFLAQKTLGIVNADWLIFRIIDASNLKTLREHHETRGNTLLLKHEIGNKDLVSNGSLDGFSVVQSNQESFNIKVFCVIPSDHLQEEQKILVKAIVNELNMLFLIFNSQYYKNKNS